jgi:16S rRNA processing protein RimM
LAVENESGAVLGTIAAVHNFGAGDLLELRPATGGDTVMVPFTEATVPMIDLAHGRVVMVPPAGFLDDAGPHSDVKKERD